MTNKNKQLELFFKQSWWMVLFVILCYYGYEQGSASRNIERRKLQAQLNLLQHEEKNALALQHKLMKQLNSQSDPEWLEMVLMKGLGLTPEGQIKVLFSKAGKEKSP